MIGVLRDPDRPLLAGRKAQAVIGTHWRKFRTEVTRRTRGIRLHIAEGIIALAWWGNSVAKEWWGNLRYDQLVAEFTSGLTNPPAGFDGSLQDLTDLLQQRPWDLPLEVWQWCLRNGLAWDGRPPQP